MNDVTIMGLNRVSNPRPNKGGSTVLAWFDCQANGFLMQGCAFVRTARRGLTVWPPKIDGPESTRRSSLGGRGDSGGPTLRDDHCSGIDRVGGAGDGAQVVGILDVIAEYKKTGPQSLNAPQGVREISGARRLYPCRAAVGIAPGKAIDVRSR